MSAVYDSGQNKSTVSLPVEYGTSQAPWKTNRLYLDNEGYEFIGAMPTQAGNLWLSFKGDVTRGRSNGNVYTLANWHDPLYVTHDELQGLLPEGFNVGKLDNLPA